MTENKITSGAGPEEIEAARVLLARLGVCPDDLVNTPSTRPPAPTFTEYIPQVSDAVSTGTRRVYSTYWKRVATEWGDRRLNEPTPLEIKQLAEKIRSQVVVRRNARDGRGAAEHLIAALRCLYNHAVDDGVISEADNPAKKAPKPRRLPSTRRGLPDSRLEEINHVAATTGNDPVLDTLILRLHTETACRRGGALALTPRDLDPDQCLILLHEKGGTVRWQPVSPTLMTHLRDHAEQRGAAASGGQLLRYTNGDPITTRRYDHLFTRLGNHLPWVATQQISIHRLRHTTLTWVERNFGYAVARAFAGHTNNNGDSATTTYTRASIHEIASALAALTGEPHPTEVSLATGPLAGISIRNQLPGQVTSIGTGGAMAAVKVSVEGAELTAAITKEAAADSHLEVGSSVMALVKSTEILRSRRLQDERGSEDFVKKV